MCIRDSPKGEASREVGDSLVVCGRDGLVVQVKSRVDATGRLDREANWTKKNVAKGCRQASGSIRYLAENKLRACLLYTSDAADDLLCVDLGGRPLIKKKTTTHTHYS